MAPPVEEYFPRGRAKASSKPTEQNKVYNKQVDKTVYHKDAGDNKFVNLFNSQRIIQGDPELFQKKKEWRAKQIAKKVAANTVPSLKYKDLREGMVMSAVVTKVEDYKAELALPFHLKASLSIANISSKFTELLKRAADDSDGEDEEMNDVPNMQQLFQIGQNIVVGVTSVTKDDHDVYNVEVSMDPKLVMVGRVPNEGDLIVAMVKSKEDHGFIMDVGNEAFTGFISKGAVKNLSEVCTGMVFLCSVQRKIGNALTLQCNQGKLFTKEGKKKGNDQSLLPFTHINVKVISKLSDGLKVDYGNRRVGYIHKNFLDPNESDLMSYKSGNQLSARIVMEIPLLNTVIFQTRNVWPFTTTFKINVGDFIKEAIVTDVMNTQLDLALGVEQAGVVPVLNAQYAVPPGSMLKDVYSEGDKVRVKVSYNDYFTGQSVCNLLRSRVDNPEMEGFKIGQVVQAVVKDHNANGVQFYIGEGEMVGYARNVFLVDEPSKNPQENFTFGKKVDCKIIGMMPEKKELLLTAKPSQVQQDFKCLSSLDSIEEDDTTLGVVGRLYPGGALIFMMNDLAGWIPVKSFLYRTGKTPEEMFFIGQSVNVKVTRVSVETEKISLRLVEPEDCEVSTNLDQGYNLRVGTFVTAKVEEVTNSGLEVEITFKDKSEKCIIPSYHLTDGLTLADTLLNSYKEGDMVKAVCFPYDTKPVLSMKPSVYYTIERCAGFSNLKKDMAIPGMLKSIDDEKIEIATPIKDCLSCVVPVECITKPDDEDLKDILELGQSITVKVVRKNEFVKQIIGSVNLMNGGMDNLPRFTSVDYLNGILQDLAFIRNRCCTESLKEMKIGSIVDAKVEMVSEMGAMLQVVGNDGEPVGVKALAPASNFGSSKPKLKSTIPVLVLFIDYQAEVIEVCCDQALVELCSNPSRNFLKIGTKLTGDIVLTRTQLKLHILAVTEPKEFKGNLVYIPDLEEDLVQSDDMGPGEKVNRRKVEVTAQIVTKRQEFICSNEELETKKRGRNEVHDDSPSKKLKKEEEIKEEILDYAVDDSISVIEKDDAMDVVIDNVPTTTLPDPGWDVNATGITLPQWGKVSIWGDEAESSDEEVTEVSDPNSNKYMSKREKKRLKKEQEKIAETQENKILQGDTQPPQTEEEFEKLVASSPNSSLVWIQYMAHFLQSCQYDMARGVAKKAVNRISFREESEILNVYLAWLNLENVFGSSESLEKVLQEAVQRNDEYKVLSQMTEVFDKSSKFPEAEKIFRTLAKKYGHNKDIWVRYGQFYFKNSRKEEGRTVFIRALQKLEVREAADISSKFAQMEFNFGETERGKTMYEKLVSTYPKRVDIWKSYAEQLTRIGDLDATRALYIRISTLGLQAKKMKALFAKWLEFETTYGTEEQQGVVRAAALQYLNKQGADEPKDA